MRSSTVNLLGALILSGSTMLGCGSASADHQHQIAGAQRAVAARDAALRALAWRNVALTAAIHLQHQALTTHETQQGYVTKLEELMVLNRELDRRLEAAESALASVVAPQEETGASPLPDGDLVERTLAELRRTRMEAWGRAQAFRVLIKNVQRLVDSGQIRVVPEPGGHAKLYAPRVLDGADPWTR
jgi:hypothetical protein